MRWLDLIKIALVFLTLLFLSSSVAFAQHQDQEALEQPSTLKVAVDLVSLRVAVTDQKGQVVTGLKKEDFRVYENKVEPSWCCYSSLASQKLGQQ